MFIAPYDDPYTIAGQGTVGTEILRQISTQDLASLHAIFVPVGGGGLIAGIAAYVKALYPQVPPCTRLCSRGVEGSTLSVDDGSLGKALSMASFVAGTATLESWLWPSISSVSGSHQKAVRLSAQRPAGVGSWS